MLEVASDPPRKVAFRLLVRLYRDGDWLPAGFHLKGFKLMQTILLFPSFLARSVHFMTYKHTMMVLAAPSSRSWSDSCSARRLGRSS